VSSTARAAGGAPRRRRPNRIKFDAREINPALGIKLVVLGCFDPKVFPRRWKKKGINFPTSGEQTREKNVDSFHCRRRASIAAAAGTSLATI
jgi:hypothetical protein